MIFIFSSLAQAITLIYSSVSLFSSTILHDGSIQLKGVAHPFCPILSGRSNWRQAVPHIPGPVHKGLYRWYQHFELCREAACVGIMRCAHYCLHCCILNQLSLPDGLQRQPHIEGIPIVQPWSFAPSNIFLSTTRWQFWCYKTVPPVEHRCLQLVLFLFSGREVFSPNKYILLVL